MKSSTSFQQFKNEMLLIERDLLGEMSEMGFSPDRTDFVKLNNKGLENEIDGKIELEKFIEFYAKNGSKREQELARKHQLFVNLMEAYYAPNEVNHRLSYDRLKVTYNHLWNSVRTQEKDESKEWLDRLTKKMEIAGYSKQALSLKMKSAFHQNDFRKQAYNELRPLILQYKETMAPLFDDYTQRIGAIWAQIEREHFPESTKRS